MEHSRDRTFQLHVSYTGLCLFVPDDDELTLHVVFPEPMPDMDEHRASIFYNSGYDTEGGMLATSYKELPVNGKIILPAGVPLDGHPPTKITPTILRNAHVANVTDVSGKPVNRTILAGDGDMVKGVIEMKGAELLSYSAAGPFTFPGDCRHVFLAWKLDWLIANIPGQSLTLGLGMTPDGAPAESHVLTAIDDVIELRVKNVILAESMPEDPPYKPPKPQGKMSHFRMYYHCLVGDPPGPEPLYERPPAAGFSIAGMLITCTPGTGQLGG